MTTITAKGFSNDLAHFQFNKKEYQKFLIMREIVFIRDKWKCVKCEKDEIIQYKQTGRSFDCHHINGNTLDNRNKNLETMCCSCHKKIHPSRKWVRLVGDKLNGG